MLLLLFLPPLDLLDFISAVQPVTFDRISEANFTIPYISCATFAILEDKIAFEGNETFAVRIQTSSLVELGMNSMANVTILDNDSKLVATTA